MKVLITGGLGYIGSHTVVELSNMGIDCVVVDNLSNSNIQVLHSLEEICKKKIEFVELDLLVKEQVRNLFESHHFSAVIHFAGLKSPSESVERPLKYYEENILSTTNLLHEMERKKIKSFVFSSSATVYGNLSTPPVNEESPTSILNPYGRTKLIIEEMLTDISLSDPEWSIIILRYFNPIGAHSSGILGEMPNRYPNNLMPYITQVATGKREFLNVYGDDYPTKDGTGVRDFIHVMDLANGHLKALNYSKENLGVHIFNLGTGKGYSVLELVNTFEEVTGINIPYKVVGRRPGDIAISYADSSKAAKELNWIPKRGLREMCEDIWKWERHKDDKYIRFL